ncbi:alcohol dehydrogenase catalytic domain-containing protein [Demequina sp. NBRC 110057]|uniref:alcohol dehydrogenase catalytic domain-containing protein n=1 Tax=Demequina sp. NBRC 110057 TaxID=1570346 RepID=UPI000A04135E|nr:alcohol dehydrogenase catalytic domain-containing protein [Demequina sp. NBRC 110057]
MPTLTTPTVPARVALWEGAPGIGLTSVACPAPAPGQVLVRVSVATVCGCVRDAVRERRLGSWPTVLGHEGVGVVEAVGRGAEALTVDGVSLAPGMRVVWGRDVGCGACAACTAGLAGACATPRELGRQPMTDAWALSGSLATHLMLPAGAALALVPSGVPDAVAAPAGCALAVAAAAVERAGSVAGRRVVVLGAGMIGLAALAMAVEAGAASATAVDPRGKRRRRALAFGADAALDVDARVPACDVVIDAAGGADTFVRVTDSLAGGGVAVVAGARSQVPDAVVDVERLSREGLALLGLGRPAPRHLADAVAFLAATHAMRPWAQIVSEPRGLDAVVEAVAHSGGSIARVAIAPALRR